MTDIVREQQIRESLSGLTGGPWQTRHHPRMLREDVPYVEIVGEIEGASYITVAQIEDVEGDDVAARDAEFIAAARQDIPWLLDQVERERSANERLRERITELAQTWRASAGQEAFLEGGYYWEEAADQLTAALAEAVER